MNLSALESFGPTGVATGLRKSMHYATFSWVCFLPNPHSAASYLELDKHFSESEGQSHRWVEHPSDYTRKETRQQIYWREKRQFPKQRLGLWNRGSQWCRDFRMVKQNQVKDRDHIVDRKEMVIKHTEQTTIILLNHFSCQRTVMKYLWRLISKCPSLPWWKIIGYQPS